jgi:hypothetical protein
MTVVRQCETACLPLRLAGGFPTGELTMKSHFYWLKVGLLIGAGIFVAYNLLPFVLLLGVFLVPVFLVFVLTIMLAAALAKPIKSLQRDFKLRQGWAARARR